MNEIKACKGGNCPLKFGCDRFLGEFPRATEYFEEPPFKKDGSCAFFTDEREVLCKMLQRDKVARRAFEIFMENRSYHDYAWFLAEIILLVEHVIRGDQAVLQLDVLKNNPSAWNFNKRAIPGEDIRLAARAIAGKRAPVQDLHWALAEESIRSGILKMRIKNALERNP